jgi:hypothetical protein
MKQKLIVEKKVENIKIAIVGLENMMSRQVTREVFLEQIERLKTITQELDVLIQRETEEYQ